MAVVEGEEEGSLEELELELMVEAERVLGKRTLRFGRETLRGEGEDDVSERERGDEEVVW